MRLEIDWICSQAVKFFLKFKRRLIYFYKYYLYYTLVEYRDTFAKYK